MKRALTSEDKTTVERLLNEFAGRLDGLVDMGTLVCIGHMTPSPRAFLLEHSEVLRALVLSVKAVLAGTESRDDNLTRKVLDKLVSAAERFQEAFLILEQFRSISLDELRVAAEAVGEVYNGVRSDFHDLGYLLDIPVRFWEGARAARDSFYQDMVLGLYSLFVDERENKRYATAVVSANR